LEARFWWNRWDSMNEPNLRETTTESYRLAIIGDDITVIRIQKKQKNNQANRKTAVSNIKI